MLATGKIFDKVCVSEVPFFQVGGLGSKEKWGET